MGIEIERKFLVVGTEWRDAPGILLRQAYLATELRCTARVRIAGERAFLTIKGAPTGEAGLARLEFEYPIPVEDANAMIDALATGVVVEKVRRVIDVEGTAWEVDAFLGVNEGLVVAEVELRSEVETFSRPPWLGDEVSSDARFANSRLASSPFASWPEAERAATRAGRSSASLSRPR